MSGDKILLTCIVTGSRDVNVTWIKDNDTEHPLKSKLITCFIFSKTLDGFPKSFIFCFKLLGLKIGLRARANFRINAIGDSYPRHWIDIVTI